MEVADHLAVLAFADGERDAAEVHFAVALAAFAEDMGAEQIDVKIAHFLPAVGEDGDGVARGIGRDCAGSVVIHIGVGFYGEAGEIDHGTMI